MIKCAYCNSPVSVHDKLCPNCGAASFITLCDSCGEVIGSGSLCRKCRASAVRARYKTAWLLFSLLVGLSYLIVGIIETPDLRMFRFSFHFFAFAAISIVYAILGLRKSGMSNSVFRLLLRIFNGVAIALFLFTALLAARTYLQGGRTGLISYGYDMPEASPAYTAPVSQYEPVYTEPVHPESEALYSEAEAMDEVRAIYDEYNLKDSYGSFEQFIENADRLDISVGETVCCYSCENARNMMSAGTVYSLDSNDPSAGFDFPSVGDGFQFLIYGIRSGGAVIEWSVGMESDPYEPTITIVTVR